ncbi:MAG: transcription elongation factor GreB [Thiobacillus sp.]
MNKAFVKEADEPDEDEDDLAAPALPAGSKNYMTPAGYAQLDAEFNQLWKVERPKLVETISWAASNGDRSENGDYIYGKKRLREIDRRIRFLSKRLEHAVVVDPVTREDTDQVFFGATVTVADDQGKASTYCIVGVDEADAGRGHIAWISPMARALLKAREGDSVSVLTPEGRREVEIIEVRYQAID